MADLVPGYVKSYQSGELRKRVAKLYAVLESRELCARKCQVNRLSGEKGYCYSARALKWSLRKSEMVRKSGLLFAASIRKATSSQRRFSIFRDEATPMQQA